MLSQNLITSPLEQFEIVTLIPLTFFGLNISVTNSVLFMIFAFLVAIF